MSCGDRRGLIDMDIQLDYSLLNDVLLLQGTHVSVDQAQLDADVGIITETGDITYTRNESIYNYPRQDQKNPLALEESSEYLVLDEHQNNVASGDWATDIDNNPPYAVQLTPEFWLSAHVDQAVLDEFNNRAVKMRVVYEFEFDKKTNQPVCLSNESTTTLPLNDLLDVCVRSMFKKTQKNFNIPENIMLNEQMHNNNVDQYLCFDDYPIDFCQFKNDAFAITTPTERMPYILNSSLEKQLEQNIFSDSVDGHTFQLSDYEIHTALYKPLSDLVKLDENGNPIGNCLSSLNSAIDAFTPAKKVYGVQYNYIVDIDQNGDASQSFDNPTIYRNGDVYGHFIFGKNMYNSMYTMDMPDVSSLQNCRSYIGIQEAGDSLVLKYTNNVDYRIIDKGNGIYRAEIDDKDGSTGSDSISSYQKIEYFRPVKWPSTTTKHKSNLFSIKIKNTGLDDESWMNANEQQRHLIENIRHDIKNSMKVLVESIVPANTQLFDTYFIQ